MLQHIDESANVGEGTSLGAFVVIAANVTVGPGSQIGNSVVIHEGAKIGSNG